MFIVYILVFVTPLIYLKSANELFEFPKMYFVYFVGLFLGFIFLKQVLIREKGLVVPNRLSLLFVVAFILSTIFSSHLHTSVWGYFSRFNGGLVSVMVLFLIYLAVLNIRSKNLEFEKKILLACFATVILVSFLSILQHFGFGGGWEEDVTIRAFSTFGQPNWLAAFLAMQLPLVYAYFLRNSGKARFLYGFLVLWSFAGLWFTYSLSGLLALFVGLIACVLLHKSFFTRRIVTYSFELVFLGTGLCVLTPGIFATKIHDAVRSLHSSGSEVILMTALAAETPLIDTTPTDFKLADSGFIRTELWRGTLDLITSSPKIFIIGVGPETFPYAFQDFRPTRLNYSSEWNYILNKPHNYYLELWSQNGLFGLLAHSAILFWVVKKRHGLYTPVFISLGVSNFFGWPTVSTTLLFWIFLAFLPQENARKINFLKMSVVKRKIVLITTTSILAIVSYTASTQFLADVFSYRAEKAYDKGYVEEALKFSNVATNLNKKEPFYFRQKAKILIITSSGISGENMAGMKKEALEDMLYSKNLNPTNLATLRGLIPLHYFLTLQDLRGASLGENSSFDFEYFAGARAYYNFMFATYPNDVGILTQLAKYQKLLGLSDDYNLTLNRVKELRPDLLNWYL